MAHVSWSSVYMTLKLTVRSDIQSLIKCLVCSLSTICELILTLYTKIITHSIKVAPVELLFLVAGVVYLYGHMNHLKPLQKHYQQVSNGTLFQKTLKFFK